jgi:hypothetical protein
MGRGRIDDAEAFAYVDEGHAYYVLTLPTQGKTFVYDVATGVWHERATLVDGEFDRWRASCHAMIEDKHIIGDYANGNLYQLSTDFYTDAGGELLSLVRVRVANNEGKPISFGSLEIDAENGVTDDSKTNPSGQATVMLRMSDDGGHNWHTERTSTLGGVGGYSTRTRFLALGQARDRVFEMSVSGDFKFVIVGAYLEAKANG